MLVIRTVCGNGIGSSLMAANNVKKICDELGIKADVASVDFANAVGEKADLYVTIKELANQFPAHFMSPSFAATSIKRRSPRILPMR